jgi:hypothetical protein
VAVEPDPAPTFDSAPAMEPIASPPAVAGDAGFDLWSATPTAPVEAEVDQPLVEPSVDVSGWVGADQEIPVWTPPLVADDPMIPWPIWMSDRSG